MQNVNAQRRAGQGVDPPHTAEIQIFKQVEQRQRGQQVGQCAQRRAVVGHVLERLAVSQTARFQHSADGRVDQRQPQPKGQRRRAVLQKAGQAVFGIAAQVGGQQVLIQKHPGSVADDAVLAEKRRVEDHRNGQHGQQPPVRGARQATQYAVQQRHAEQQQQIVRDKPQLPGRGRERRPPQCTEGDIQPGEPAQQRDGHRVEPQ